MGYPGEECTIPTKKGMMIKGPALVTKGKESEEIQKVVEFLNQNTYIGESKSTWTNAIRPVKKSNGTIRLCMNMMALNEICEL